MYRFFNDTYWSNTTRYRYDEKESMHVYEIEAAGKAKSDVDIKHQNDFLIIKIGDITYNAWLANDADMDNIKAIMKYGLLTITIPSKKGKDIKVE